MNKKIAIIYISFAMAFSFIIIIIEIAPVVEAPTIIYVDDSGGADYATIQEGIIASSDGDTVRVYEGIYNETVTVDKRINLIGNGSEKTIIDGGWPDHQNVVTILASRVNISGFGIKNSYMGHEFGGIGVQSSGNRIFDNHCWNNLYGAILWGDGNRICNNSFSNNQRDGIFVKSSGNIIENNTCSNSLDRDGIWLYICTNNTVSNNTCSNNSKNGISFYQSHNNLLFNNTCINSVLYDGILIYESSNNKLWNNTLSSNNRGGFGLSHFADNNTLTNNTLTENQIGVNIYDNCDNNTVHYNNVLNNGNGIFLGSSSNNNTITNNSVYLNWNYGIYLELVSNNRIHHNNIISNTNQAYDSENNNFWNDTYPSGGNYWSDLCPVVDKYSGPLQNILGSDGINDSAYIIDSDSQDNYPQVSPIGNFIFLHEGWNLISIPLIQTDSDLDMVVKSIKGSYDAVWRYNTSDNSDYWKVNDTSKPSYMNNLDGIVHTMGFWVHITEPGGVLFEYFGIQSSKNQTIALYPGWNLVGYPSLTRYNRTDGLNNLTIDTHVDSIWTYNTPEQRWKEIGPTDYFESGRGYWIYAKSKCVWEVPL